MKSSGFFYFALSLFILLQMPFNSQGQAPVAPSVGSAADSNTSTESSDQFYLCRRDKNVRWLRAYKMETGKCRALYSKEGYLQVISSATYFASCEGVLQNVKKNLEEGGFKCSLMSQVSMIDFEGQ